MILTFADELAIASPAMVLAIGALAVLLIEVGMPRSSEREGLRAVDMLSFFTLVVALAQLVGISPLISPGLTVLRGAVFADPFSWFVSLVIVLAALVALMLGAGRLSAEGIRARGEFLSLYLMSTAGAVMFVSAAEAITLFLGLEIMSMPLYCLCSASICGSGVQQKRSAESGLKYFLLGSFSSAFMLYGIAVAYGLTGSTKLITIAGAVPATHSVAMYLAAGLILVGLAFKVAAVPFHFWAPDVYQGAPTTVTAFMASAVKVAAVAVTMRILWGVFDLQIVFHSGVQAVFWSGAVATLAVLTMCVGNLVALRQRSIKRMLAYSSIAHAGYMFVALLAPGGEFGGGAAILYYLVAYSVMTLGAFGVVLLVIAPHLAEQHSDDLSRFAGLSSRKPFLAALMALFMLSLAGIPPGLAGLLGKFYLFSAAVKADYTWLAVIGVVNSAISCYYYLRVIVVMYFQEQEHGESETAPAANDDGIDLVCRGALVLCAAGVIILGLFPSVLHSGAVSALINF